MHNFARNQIFRGEIHFAEIEKEQGTFNFLRIAYTLLAQRAFLASNSLLNIFSLFHTEFVAYALRQCLIKQPYNVAMSFI